MLDDYPPHPSHPDWRERITRTEERAYLLGLPTHSSATIECRTMKLRMFDKQSSLDTVTYPWAYEMTPEIWTSFWTPAKFDFRGDVQQFKTEMTEEERDIVVRALSAISQVEYSVKLFWSRLGTHFPHHEFSDLASALANCEVIHSRAYRKLLDTLGIREVFRDHLKIPVFADRVKYLNKHLESYSEDPRRQTLYSVILFTLFVENVSLFGQFYTVLWFNRFRAVLKDTAQQIQYTRNEEMLHARVGIQIVRTLRSEYPELFDDSLVETVLTQAREALSAERGILSWILDGFEAPGLDEETVHYFVSMRMESGLRDMGFPTMGIQRDAEMDKSTMWMDEETLGNNQTDFFYKEPVEYAKHNRSYSAEDLF